MNFNRTLAQRLQLRIFEYGSLITVLLVVSIYFPTSLSIIVSALMGLFWLLSAQFMALPATLKKNSVAAWSLLLFLCFILGTCYGNAPFGEALAMMMKYSELLFIPVLIPFLSAERYRCWAWKAFFIASAVTLLISYLMDIGILEVNNQGDPCLKGRITHSIFIFLYSFVHTFVVTSLFNSPFLDHTERHWFASMIALCFAPFQTDIKAGIINA